MDEPAPKRRRRWYQFSLRTLMLFMVVCAILSAWVGWKLEATRREQVAVARIDWASDMEAWHNVGYHQMYGKPWWITRHFRRVRCIILVGTATDNGLEHLKQLTKLEVLSLKDTQITDAGLIHLEELSNLERLDFEGTQVTDEGVEKLQKALPNCTIHH